MLHIGPNMHKSRGETAALLPLFVLGAVAGAVLDGRPAGGGGEQASCSFVSGFLRDENVTSWEFQLTLPSEDVLVTSNRTRALALATVLLEGLQRHAGGDGGGDSGRDGPRSRLVPNSLRWSVDYKTSSAVSTVDGRPLPASSLPPGAGPLPWREVGFLRLRMRHARHRCTFGNGAPLACSPLPDGDDGDDDDGGDDDAFDNHVINIGPVSAAAGSGSSRNSVSGGKRDVDGSNIVDTSSSGSSSTGSSSSGDSSSIGGGGVGVRPGLADLTLKLKRCDPRLLGQLAPLLPRSVQPRAPTTAAQRGTATDSGDVRGFDGDGDGGAAAVVIQGGEGDGDGDGDGSRGGGGGDDHGSRGGGGGDDGVEGGRRWHRRRREEAHAALLSAKVENDVYCRLSRPTYEAKYAPLPPWGVDIGTLRDAGRYFPFLEAMVGLGPDDPLPSYNNGTWFLKAVWSVEWGGRRRRRRASGNADGNGDDDVAPSAAANSSSGSSSAGSGSGGGVGGGDGGVAAPVPARGVANLNLVYRSGRDALTGAPGVSGELSFRLKRRALEEAAMARSGGGGGTGGKQGGGAEEEWERRLYAPLVAAAGAAQALHDLGYDSPPKGGDSFPLHDQ